MQGQELHSMILMDPFQLRVFYDLLQLLVYTQSLQDLPKVTEINGSRDKSKLLTKGYLLCL